MAKQKSVPQKSSSPWTAKDIELVPVKDLIPYRNNAKEHPKAQILALAEMFQEFGIDQPIVIGPDNTIIKGHGRRLAALHLKLKSFPCIRVPLETQKAMLSRLGDNRIAETGWDYPKLGIDLRILREQDPNQDFTKLGFQPTELKVCLDGWVTDFGAVEKTKENLDGIQSKLVVRCPQELKERLIAAVRLACEPFGKDVTVEG
jgi:hypothetical protein